jgi:2-deoxy-D-gluconate 3-dehydrogenase
MTKLFKLTGKAALVTGGNGGIGLGIARGLAQAGARIAIIVRNTEKSHAAAKALAEETGVAPLVLTADVSVPDQVAAVVSDAKNGLGRFDILFNNAGTSIRKPPQDLTPEEWHKVMDVNLTSAFLSMALLRSFLDNSYPLSCWSSIAAHDRESVGSPLSPLLAPI